jgi:hypothetical protein
MTPELWQRLKPLYHAALELPKERRDRFVAAAGGGDALLRRELQALLEANDEGTGTFDEPLFGVKDFVSPERGPAAGESMKDRFNGVRGGDGRSVRGVLRKVLIAARRMLRI